MINNSMPIIDCIFKTSDSLYQSYMPFLQGGGLFVKTTQHYDLGDLVVLHVTLADDPTIYPVSGKIAWITPIGAQGNKPAGVGVQLIDNTSDDVRHKIKNLLGDRLNASDPTNTM